MTTHVPGSIDETVELLSGANYIADRPLATVAYLALKMGRPLFLEGEAGVGKTEIAKVLAETLGRDLIRLQCYEGLDLSAAVYEWNYSAQMIEIRMAEAEGVDDRDRLQSDIFSDRFLIKRPLLRALEPHTGGAPVLLIDELDRTDEAFEAFLLEVLSDYQITIPEIGTIKAAEPPIVIITSNRTREVHDALKRRCLYHWVGYPSAELELDIIKRKKPDVGDQLAQEVVGFIQALRGQDLFKSPGVAETLDWVSALNELNALALDPKTVNDTLGVLLKYQDDIARMEGSEAKRLVEQIRVRDTEPDLITWHCRQPTRTSRRRLVSSRPISCILPACCATPACLSGLVPCWMRWTRCRAAACPRRRIFTGYCIPSS
jgi:MoxR-like ATPase